MKPVHIVTEKENISPLVLMPGDPLRAKYIAEKFLSDAKLINTVRNMFGYTGTYKGHRITVIGSGMGMPSMSIYAYELIHFYDVKEIIRIGSAGAFNPSVKIRDIVVATEAKTISTFAFSHYKIDKDTEYASSKLIEDIKNTVTNERVHFGPILTGDVFDVYTGVEHVLNRLHFTNALAGEMETFALYLIGKMEGIETASMLTVVDSKYEPDITLTSEERETSLDEMIGIALDALIK